MFFTVEQAVSRHDSHLLIPVLFGKGRTTNQEDTFLQIVRCQNEKRTLAPNLCLNSFGTKRKTQFLKPIVNSIDNDVPQGAPPPPLYSEFPRVHGELKSTKTSFERSPTGPPRRLRSARHPSAQCSNARWRRRERLFDR